MGHPGGPHRGGVSRTKIALRDALRVYIWQHLSKYPQSWFTAVDLARVIREQYIRDPLPPSVAGGYHHARSNVIMSVLRELRDQGDVISKPAEYRRDCTCWRIAGAS